MNGRALWYGEDGTPYEYKVFDLETPWNDVPGNYIFAKFTGSSWKPLYIGETTSLKVRLTTNHHQWPCAQSHGVTHIHAHTSSKSLTSRRNEEMNLIRQHNPPCNRFTGLFHNP